MTAILALIGGPFGKWIGYGAAVLAVLAGAAFWLHTHDAGVRAALEAQQQAAIAKAQAVMQQQADAAVSAAVDAERARAAQNAQIREVIRRVPVSTGCVGSPAIAAALRELRAPAGAGDANGAGGAAVVRP